MPSASTACSADRSGSAALRRLEEKRLRSSFEATVEVELVQVDSFCEVDGICCIFCAIDPV
jgi:hypothetical protein